MNTLTLRATTTADTIAALAWTVGYRPEDSLVVAALRADNSIGMVARIDLADLAHQSADTLAVHVANDRAQRAILAAYTNDPEAADDAVGAMTCALHGQAIDVAQAIHVAATTYVEMLIDDAAPRPLSDVETSAVAAHAVYLGRSLNATRADLLPRPAEPDARAAAASGYAFQIIKDDQTRGALSAWRRAMAGEVTGAQVYGELAAMLTNKNVRDAVLLTLIPGVDPQVAEQTVAGEEPDAAVGRAMAAIIDPAHGVRPGDAARTGADLLAQIVAHLPEDSTPAWTLWALVAWWSGNGSAAREALNRTREGYRLAGLLAQAVDSGLAPGWVRHSRDTH